MERIEITKAILSFLSSLAWPIVAGVVALRFRPEIRTLLARLRSGEFAGAKFALAEAAEAITARADAIAAEPDPGQRGRIAAEIKEVASTLGAVSNEWFKYDVRFRGLPEQFAGAFLPQVAAGTPTAALHYQLVAGPGEFVGTFFIRTLLSHNTLQGLAEQSGLTFLDVANVASAGFGRQPRNSAAA